MTYSISTYADLGDPSPFFSGQVAVVLPTMMGKSVKPFEVPAGVLMETK